MPINLETTRYIDSETSDLCCLYMCVCGGVYVYGGGGCGGMCMVRCVYIRGCGV